MSDAKMWYVALGGESIGPMGREDVLQGLRSGEYTDTTLAFRDGMSGWTAVGQIPELKVGTDPQAPPPPVPDRAMTAHEIDFEVFGEEMQFVEIELDPQEATIAEAGSMMYMEDGIEMQTIFGDGSHKDQGGGLMGKVLGAGKRLLTGESLFMTVFAHTGPSGKRKVAFAAPYPGKIMPMDLSQLGGKLICQKDAFLCAAKGVSVGIAFQKKIGAGLFGGEGFIMQKLEGDGLAFVHAGGTIVSKQLGPGDHLRVDTGCLVALESSVNYDVEFVGGIKSAIFGGEGFFFASLRGPGRVWLQSLPFSRLAGKIIAAAPTRAQPGGGRTKGEGSVLGALGGIGGLLED